MKVERVAEHHLVAQAGDLGRGEPADAPLRCERDERGSGDLAVPEMNQARAGVAVTGLDLEPEPVWIRPDPVRLWGWLLLLDRAFADLNPRRIGLRRLPDLRGHAVNVRSSSRAGGCRADRARLERRPRGCPDRAARSPGRWRSTAPGSSSGPCWESRPARASARSCRGRR